LMKGTTIITVRALIEAEKHMVFVVAHI